MKTLARCLHGRHRPGVWLRGLARRRTADQWIGRENPNQFDRRRLAYRNTDLDQRKCWRVKLDRATRDNYTMLALIVVDELQVQTSAGWTPVAVKAAT